MVDKRLRVTRRDVLRGAGAAAIFGATVGPVEAQEQAADGLRKQGPGATKVELTLNGKAIALNVEPDLSHFTGIVPCGVGEDKLGVTSLADLGVLVSMPEVDSALRAAFVEVFG